MVDSVDELFMAIGYWAELTQIRDENGGKLPEELQRLVDSVRADDVRFDPLWRVDINNFPPEEDEDYIRVRAPDLATAQKIWGYLRPYVFTRQIAGTDFPLSS